MEVLSHTAEVQDETVGSASPLGDEVEDGELLEEDLSDSDGKLQSRAQRFGLSAPAKQQPKNQRISRLHKIMGVNSQTRTETLHLYGTDSMKSEDVFDYFEGYTPASLEWLTAKTCNVIWLDEEACAEALLRNSVRIIPTGEDYEPTEPEEEYIKEGDLRCALPPGIWRKGRANFMAPSLFMRFATFSDKKGNQIVSGRANDLEQQFFFPDQGDEALSKRRANDDGNPWSGIAREWGHFERTVSQKVLMTSLRDARHVIARREILKPVKPLRDARELISSNDLVDWGSDQKAQGPRMKMHADIEEEISKQKNKQYRKENVTDLRQKLGKKRKYDPYSDGCRSTPSPPPKSSLQIEIDNSDGPLLTDIKTRSDSSSESDSDEEIPTNLSDLREKLKNSTLAKIPLRIEIDNDLCKRQKGSSD